jgi:hypothetical protein
MSPTLVSVLELNVLLLFSAKWPVVRFLYWVTRQNVVDGFVLLSIMSCHFLGVAQTMLLL